MTLLQAIRYFISEALSNMRRSWKVSLLAILVTAVSLFLGGALFLAGSNLAETLESWQAKARLVVYLEVGASEEARQAVEEQIRELEFADGWTYVSPQEARARLGQRLPELGELMEGLEQTPLPASFEIQLRRRSSAERQVNQWLQEIGLEEGVAGFDDDRKWIQQIALAATIFRFAALTIGALLMAGSIFIIASVIRLAALLHREEIRVLRLVGATEFFVRGPFVVGGILQGLLGSALAVAALALCYLVLLEQEIPDLIERLLLSSFLDPVETVLLGALGIGAGLVGGILSVRKTAAGLW